MFLSVMPGRLVQPVVVAMTRNLKTKKLTIVVEGSRAVSHFLRSLYLRQWQCMCVELSAKVSRIMLH